MWSLLIPQEHAVVSLGKSQKHKQLKFRTLIETLVSHKRSESKLRLMCFCPRYFIKGSDSKSKPKTVGKEADEAN